MERDCLRCGTKMEKGYKLKLNYKVYDTIIAKSKGGPFSTIGKPKVSICPKCGEISMYMDDFQNRKSEK